MPDLYNDFLTCRDMLCLLQLSKPQLQHVLLPLHHRSLQVLLAGAEQDPEIFLRSTHGIVLLHQMMLISITIVDNLNSGAWLGLVALCARNFHASQHLLLRLPLSLCGQVCHIVELTRICRFSPRIQQFSSRFRRELLNSRRESSNSRRDENCFSPLTTRIAQFSVTLERMRELLFSDEQRRQ